MRLASLLRSTALSGLALFGALGLATGASCADEARPERDPKQPVD